jgi:hypothetical protein
MGYPVYTRLEQLLFITECDFDAEEYTSLTDLSIIGSNRRVSALKGKLEKVKKH